MTGKNILFVIPTMQQGGAERVVSVISGFWANKGNRVAIISFDNSDSYYSLHQAVKHYKLNSTVRSWGIFNFVINNIKRTFNYFKYIRNIQPEVIISFTDNANVYCILYNWRAKKPLIITQRTNPRFSTLPAVIRSLPGKIYRTADAMVVQTAATIEIYKELGIQLPPIAAVIPNPLHKLLFEVTPGISRKKIILAVGRLNNKDKQFDRLIGMFNACNTGDWKLFIAGDGEDKLTLLDQIAKLGLKEKVMLLGDIKELAPVYQGAAIFAMASQFEGFPNALCEAMANGCACISFNCPTGPAEIIRNGENGILVNPGDEETYVRELSSLMNDEEKRTKYSIEAIKTRLLLDEQVIIQQWELLINKILKQNN